MKAFFMTFLVLTSAYSFASEICTISSYKYDQAQDIKEESNNFKKHRLDSWEECFSLAVKQATETNYKTSINILTLVAADPNVSIPGHYNSSALVQMGYAKWVKRQGPAVTVITWTFNDSYISDSKGEVSRYTDSAYPETGHVAIDVSKALINP